MKLIAFILVLAGMLSAVHAQTKAITQDTYDLILKYGQLCNVAYCVRAPGPFGLQDNFTCGKACSHFPDTELVYKFGGNFFSTSITGFLAVNHEKKEKYIVFRGTFSIADAITDIQFLQKPYLADLPPLNTTNINSTHPLARPECPGCEIFDGFQKAYRETMVNMGDNLINHINSNPDYKLVVTGHSLGAATGLLMAINLKNLGLDPVVVLYGQPRVGNKAFADYANSLFFDKGSNGVDITNSTRLYRVTHWNDVVVGLPFWSGYTHTIGEVYISYPNVASPIRYVHSCAGASNRACHSGNFNLFARFNILKNHCSYLSWIFYCAINVGKRDLIHDPPRVSSGMKHWSEGQFSDQSEQQIYDAVFPN